MARKMILFGSGLLVFALAEAGSYAAFFNRDLNAWATGIICVAALILSFKNLKYGLFILAGELVIGSQGYLFYFGSEGSKVSLRIMLWIIVMALWFSKELSSLLRKEPVLLRYSKFRYIKPLLALGASVLLGAAVGRLMGNDASYFFLEAKRWVYALVILPFLSEFQSKKDIEELFQVAAAGVVWLGIKTLAVVYVFSHAFVPLMFNVYDWTRFTLLGEITRLPNGFSRVFIQSQIFLLPGLFFLLMKNSGRGEAEREGRRPAFLFSIASVVAAALIASLSRSFWVAAVIALAVGFSILAFAFKAGYRNFFRQTAYALAVGCAGIILLFAAVRFPYPKPSATIDADLLRNRATQMEAGAASRWSLLPVMGREIIKSPLWGYGFGKTLTYVTSDPRVTASTTDGEYTTYAFEWGWLDIGLKLGLLGLAAYAWLLWAMLADAWQLAKKGDSRGLAIGMSLLALAAVHFFTPYLNHPLGFGYLALMMVFLRSAQGRHASEGVSLPKF